MVIVLKKNITQSQKDNLKSFLSNKQFKLNEIVGEEETILAAVGKVGIDLREVEIQDGVSKVVPISKPYKLASREFKKEDTVVEIPNNRGQIIKVGGPRIISLAGPAVVESKNQIEEIAKCVAESGAVMLHADAYNSQSSPYAFQGLGEEALGYLKAAGNKYGLPVVTEIVDASLIPVMQRYEIDVYQVGPSNMQNFELLKKLGSINKPVILKRGLSATLEDFLMSAEYLMASGCEKVILCEQGIRTFEKVTRNTLDLSAVPVLRSLTHLPIIVDPSYAVGIRDKVPQMALASIAAGADGILVECHNHPEKALSDGAQSLLPEMFDKLMHNVVALAPVVGRAVEHIWEVAVEDEKLEAVTKKDKIICAYNGNPGAYAQQAVDRFFDSSTVEAMPEKSFGKVFQDVLDGKADYGMIPIENSTTGSIYQNYDNLARFADIEIVGTVTLNIRHALLGIKGTKLSDIKNVYSHPQGLFQCQKYLEPKEWKQCDSISTSTAAKYVAQAGSKENAAIASAVNASLYGLEVIQEDIEDNPNNFTRFIVIAAKGRKAKAEISNIKPAKASIMFKIRNEPGALYKCLGLFAKEKLNMTRLESRPIDGETWTYWFYIEIDLSGQDGDLKKTIEALKDYTEDIRLLGCYS